MKNAPGAFKSSTSPVVKINPVEIPISVVAPFVNVPYESLGQLIVALEIVRPPLIIEFTTSIALPP